MQLYSHSNMYTHVLSKVITFVKEWSWIIVEFAIIVLRKFLARNIVLSHTELFRNENLYFGRKRTIEDEGLESEQPIASC